MLCECGEREATIHEVVIRNGKRYEKHLCEQCAAKHGIKIQPSVPSGELLAKFMLSKAVGAPGATCPGCGLTWAEFKKHELLGCPRCYQAFESRLSPLLERTHGGVARHVGKAPKGALERARHGGEVSVEELVGSAEEQAERLGALRQQLEEAVNAEQFERAAQLRDEIRRLSTAEL